MAAWPQVGFLGCARVRARPAGRSSRPPSIISPVVGRRRRSIHSADMPTNTYTAKLGPMAPAARCPIQRNARLLPPPRQQGREYPLTCGFGARGGIRTLDLPITRRILRVGLVGSRRIEAAHLGCRVGPDGSRRIQKDRLDDHRDDQGASDNISDSKASGAGTGTPSRCLWPPRSPLRSR
jgi:hypothetical protein